jgi:cytochrome P450
MGRYLEEQIRWRRESIDPPDDLISALIAAEMENGDRLSDPEIRNMLQLLLVAGNSTTTDALCNLVYQLERHPEEKRKLLADLEGLAATAVEEGLRFDGPIHGIFRTCLEDYELAGVKIPKGARIYVLFAAGSHDPAAFERSDEFVIDRRAREANHFAFGWGIHFCMGANLARREVRVALQTLYGRLANLRLARGFVPQQKTGFFVRGWESLEMEYDGHL